MFVLVLFFLLPWFLFCSVMLWAVYSILKKKEILSSKSKYNKFGFALFILVFLSPFLPDIILHIYQVSTMPFVCKKMAGYHPYSPVKLTSYFATTDPLAMLQLPNTEYTEWDAKGHELDTVGHFPKGKYRFRYFPLGSAECSLLNDYYPSAKIDIKSWRERFSRNGYKLNNEIDMCLGVQKIDHFEAKYTLLHGPVTNFIESGFGYKVLNDFIELRNLATGETVSRLQVISTKSPTPFLSLISEYDFLEKKCPILEPGSKSKIIESELSLKTERFFYDLVDQ